MKLIINHSSMQPIYEQISGQIKDLIIHGELTEGTVLPSVRTLARELMNNEELTELFHIILEES